MASDPTSALIALIGGDAPAEAATPVYPAESKLLLDDVGPGTHVSDDFVARCHGGGVMVEVIPVGTAGSADLTVLDSGAPYAGYEAANDAAGTVTGIAARRKIIVANVGPYVKVRLVVSTGRWSVVVTPIRVTREATYQTIATGELAGSTTALQLPNVPCRLAKLKARYDNAGRVYLGAAGVTRPDGTTDVTTGLELSAGEETGWLPISNLNVLYRISDNAGDDLTYLALA